MTYTRYQYDIMKFKTPRHFVAQVTVHDLGTGAFATWCYTQDDLRRLEHDGTEPVKINLVHGTTRAWWDDMVNEPENVLDLDAYFDTERTSDAQAKVMLAKAKIS